LLRELVQMDLERRLHPRLEGRVGTTSIVTPSWPPTRSSCSPSFDSSIAGDCGAASRSPAKNTSPVSHSTAMN
jgi:hypothetical protein